MWYNAYIYTLLLIPNVVSVSFKKKWYLGVIMENEVAYHLGGYVEDYAKLGASLRKSRDGLGDI